MSGELSRIEAGAAPAVNPAMQIIAAKDAAKVCREIVKACAVNIGGRRYVPIEGWQTIGAAFGCVLSAGEVEAIEGGIRARGRVIRAHDGAVIAEAEGFIGDDEKTWAARPLYARRAMAQTRAMSRAARGAFAFVVTLIDKNLNPVPAEEVPDGGFPEPRRTAAAPPRRTRQAAAAPPPEDDGPPPEDREEREASRPLFQKGGR
jgi:hypothetical protein